MQENTILVTKVIVRPECKPDFLDWQARLNARIAAFPGFISLEILSPIEPLQPEWVIVQRFYNAKSLEAWQDSKNRIDLMDELEKYLIKKTDAKHELKIAASGLQSGVTEIFVTRVSHDKESDYREWIAKIHKEEAKFPGFRGVYLQSPTESSGEHWITLLQFDTPDNLDRWLVSPERKKILDDASSLIASIENHRVISPYAGWFSTLINKGEAPPVWKQTMLVLLGLFPLIMLELKFLSPVTSDLNPALATFIGNALSVTLIAWPVMPIAILSLGWWLTAHKQSRWNFLGTFVIILLYILELVIFWNLTP